MFLLNNCKLLIFSDVRHGLHHLAKMPGIGELGHLKKCPWVCACVCVCTCREHVAASTALALAGGMGSSRCIAAGGAGRAAGHPWRGEQHPCRSAPKLYSVT